MVNTYLDSALKRLDRLEKNCSLDSPLKDQVLTLKQKSRFLRTYLIYSGISEAIPFASSSVISSVELEAAFKTATDELSSVCLLPSDFEKVDSVVSYLLENVKLCEPEIRKAYAILWEQPQRETNPPLIPASSMDFIDSIMENLEELLGSESLASMMKKTVEILKGKLSYLRNFIDITARRSIIHQEFLSHVHVSATSAACFSYLCWDCQLDQVMASGMADKLSDLLQKIKPSTSDLMDMFIGLLKASISVGLETTKTDEIASFISFLLENTVESLKDRIDSIHEELVYLIAFLMDLPDECPGDLERISADIKAAAKEAALFQVNKEKEEQVKEMNLVISRMLQKMKLIRAGIFLQQIVDSEEDTLMVHVKDNFTALHEVLKFLGSLPIGPPEEKEEDRKLLSKHVQTMASEVTSLIYSIHHNKLTDNMVMKMKLELGMLLQKIKLIKADLYLMDLQNHTPNLVSPMKDQIGNLQEGLLFLRTFLVNTTDIESNMHDGKLFSVQLENVINESSSLIFSCFGSEMTEDMASELNLSIFRLLDKIKLIKAEVILGELLRFPEFGLMVHMKDEFETLQEGIRFVRAFLMNPPKAEGELILAKSEATANEAASLIFSIHCHVRKENMAFESKMNHLLPELVEKIEFLKAEIKDTFLQVPYSNWYHLPETKEMEFIQDLLLDTIKMLNPEAISLALVKRQTEMLLGEFKFLESFIMDNEELYIHNEHQELKDIMVCIADVSWVTKYIIDLIMDRDESVWYFMLSVYFVVEDIKLIKAKVREIYDERKYDNGAHSVSPARPLTIDDVVVGFRSAIEILLDQLIRETKKMDIVSIVGMPGIGKTTLAQKVYHHPLVVLHFPIRAWCCVSQKYQIRDLLLKILRDIKAVTNSTYEMSDDELAGELLKHLMQKRYLIVLDDIWAAEALDDLRRTFPENNSGSRILLTSRIHDVVVQADSTNLPYFLRPRSDEECWTLFGKKIFGGEPLPYEMVKLGMWIIKRCRGLPLAVILIAGLLSNTETTLCCWEQVIKGLSLRIIESPLSPVQSVLTLGYESLPDDLKPCFLCFGEFPEDKEIHARKLFELWIKKGLIRETDSKTLEDVAEEGLLNLTSRNLVTVSRRRYNGKVRACRLHDVLRDFCIEMQKKCTFFT